MRKVIVGFACVLLLIIMGNSDTETSTAPTEQIAVANTNEYTPANIIEILQEYIAIIFAIFISVVGISATSESDTTSASIETVISKECM